MDQLSEAVGGWKCSSSHFKDDEKQLKYEREGLNEDMLDRMTA